MGTHSDNAITIYRTLYFNPNENKPQEVHARVADCISNNEIEFTNFYKLLEHNVFRPNTPCMINSKKTEDLENIQFKDHDMNLAACFVLELKDDMDSIMNMWGTCAKVYAGGGGIGLPLSNLREKDASISSGGRASGPIKYLEVVQTISDTVKSGGKSRRAANLTSFRYNHPDIKEYITCKLGGKFSAVNISVLVSNNFMSDVESKNWDKTIPLVSPYKKSIVGKTTVGEIWRLLIKTAWESGDPGLLFYDEANKHNAFPSTGEVEAANPCLPGWAPVLTNNGYRHFYDIKNEIYINGDNKYCSDLIKTGEDRSVYEIILRNGISLYMTEEHKVTTDCGDIMLKDLDLDLHKVKMDYTPITYDFDKNDWENGFLSGYLFADGSIYTSKEKIQCSFCLGGDEINIKDYCQTLIQEKLNCNYEYIPHSQSLKCLTLKINTNEANSKLLTIFGNTNKDTYDLLDNKYSTSYQLGFISAMLTFDGSVTIQPNHQTYKCCIHQSGDRGIRILKQIQLILSSLGIYSNFGLRNKAKLQEREDGSFWNYKPAYTLEIIDNIELNKHIKILCPNKNLRFQEICNLNRPVSLKRISKLKQFQPISEIKYIGTHDVYDIQVPDGNHFVTCAGIVHNCGEVLLPDNSMCNLGSINLNKCLDYIDENKYVFNFDKLKEYTKLAQNFLDNVIDKTTYPTKKFKERMVSERPIGLGLMGLSDIFYKMKIQYGSKESIQLFENICKEMTKTAFEYGIHRCQIGQVDPIHIPEQDYDHFINRLKYFGVDDEHIELFKHHGCRNSTVTSIAPTGSISISADCSYAFEPCFALIWSKRLVDRDETLFFVNEIFKDECKKRNIELTKELMGKISINKGSCKGIPEIPEDMQEIFVTAHDLGWKKKIEMQEVGQRWVTLGISSTCNLPYSATIEDVESAYILAWKSKLKGITVYRDGCLNTQPINFGAQTTSDEMTVPTQLTPMKRPMKRTGTTVEINTPHGKLYLTGNVDKKKQLFEAFMRMGQQGHVTNILLDALGKVMSKALQYGVPLKAIIDTMHQCGGFPFFFKLDDSAKKSEQAESIVDAIAKLIDFHFNENSSNTCDIVDNSLGKCPQCGQMTLVIGSGCRGGSCANPECGYSKCG